jgi:membrane protein
MKHLLPVKEFYKEVYLVWVSEKPNQLAAALAYFGIFSFAAVIYLAFRIAGIFIDEAAAAERFYSRVATVLGPEIATFIQDTVVAITSSSTGASILATIVSVGSLLFAAMGMFLQLKYVLNRIWHVPLAQTGQKLAMIRRYFFAFIMVIALSLLVIMITLVNIIFGLFASIINDYFEISNFASIAGILALLAIFILAHAFTYKILPDIKLTWRDVWLGSIVATLVMAVGVLLLTIYYKFGGVQSAMQAAGAFAVVIIAIYYFAQIFLMGAIITRVYARRYGSLRGSE